MSPHHSILRAVGPKADFFPSLRALTQAAGPWLALPLKFIRDVWFLIPLERGPDWWNVGFSLPTTLGFIAVSLPGFKLAPNHCSTL